MDDAQAENYTSGEQLNSSTMTEHGQEQVLQKPSQYAPFLEWAQYYISDAKKETKDAQSSLTASGYINPIEYTNKFNSLDRIKKSFEKFQKLIEESPHLSSEITLSREQLRVNVKRAIKQIEVVQTCIQDPASPCNDIEGKFKSLLQTLRELGKDCKLKDQ